MGSLEKGCSTHFAQHNIKELHNTFQNPSETNPYPQEPCQHATAKQKLHQATTVILRLDFTFTK